MTGHGLSIKRNKGRVHFNQSLVCFWCNGKVYYAIIINGADFKTSHFAQSLRQAQILILEILNVFLWLNFSPFLTLNKLKRFETGSMIKVFPERLIKCFTPLLKEVHHGKT